MNRRQFLFTSVITTALSSLSWRAVAAQAANFIQPAAYWRKHVSAAAWEVLFREHTERSHSSPLNDEKRAGTYVCAACYQPLFSSAAKYESGTGWPSFFQALPNALGEREDYRFFMVRTEYHCKRCGGHQGHVFNDGPKPTGLRYCNNGLALAFIPKGQPLPRLRGAS